MCVFVNVVVATTFTLQWIIVDEDDDATAFAADYALSFCWFLYFSSSHKCCWCCCCCICNCHFVVVVDAAVFLRSNCVFITRKNDACETKN